jgi:hypothetical protein
VVLVTICVPASQRSLPNIAVELTTWTVRECAGTQIKARKLTHQVSGI